MKLALVTDAWLPQTNGVVRTLEATVRCLRAEGVDVRLVTPQEFRTVPCPTYPEIRLALLAGRRLARAMEEFAPDSVHIATEGPLGLAARRWCLDRGFAFTTAYHTRFPEYLRARAPVPLAASYAWLRRFHGAARRTFVATPSLQRQLEQRGFSNIVRWSRGVDADLFRPHDKGRLPWPRPLWLYFGRVAVEKGVHDFLRLDLPGTKVVIGDGPARAAFEAQFPGARFLGCKHGEDLASHVAACDAFVFPSRTDTFGLVLLEAMASGLPVAALPVTGPLDVVVDGVTGSLDPDLRAAAMRCLALDPARCREHALQYSWQRCTRQFLSHLVRGQDPTQGRALVSSM